MSEQNLADSGDAVSPVDAPAIVSGRSDDGEGKGEPSGLMAMRRRTWLSLIITSLVLAALVGVLLQRIGQAHQQAAAAPKGSLTSQSAPNVEFMPWNGKSIVQLGAYFGKPVVLNFWQSDCVPCEQEMPTFTQAYAKWSKQGVVFLGLAEGTTDAAGRSWIKQYHVSYPSGPDEGLQGAVEYGVVDTPVTVFIDKHGHVVKKVTGAVGGAALDATIQQLLKS